jgi:hypothetical protein
MAKRGKKPITNSKRSSEEDEKALLRDILEEEELLLDGSDEFNDDNFTNDYITNEKSKELIDDNISKKSVIKKKKVIKNTKEINNTQQKKIQKKTIKTPILNNKLKKSQTIKKELVKKKEFKKPTINKKVKKKIDEKENKESFSEDAITGLLNEQNQVFTQKKEKLQRQLIKEPKFKKNKSNDEDIIHQLFNDEDNIPLPRPKENSKPDSPVDKDFLRLGRSSDILHKKELQNAFERYPKIHRNKIIKSIIYTILLAVCFVLIITNTELFDLKKVYEPTEKLIPMIINETEIYEVSVNKTINQNITFDNFSTMDYDKEISILGYLKYELVEVKDLNIYKHEYYIVDDVGKEIELLKIIDQYKQNFIQDNITRGVYLVTGKIESGFQNPELKVQSIKPAQKPTIQIEETIVKERIVQKEILVSI